MAVKAACGNGFPLNIPSVIPESGGSGGTGDYSDLTNKPQINSVTLSGNKSLSDIGAASAADVSDIQDLIPSDASTTNKLATADDIPGVATTSAPGIVQPDGTTITISNGVISAVGGAGSGEIYSATPVKVGSWLGSDLYRVVISAGAMPSGEIGDTVKEVNADIITGTLVMANLYARANVVDTKNLLQIPYTSITQITNCISWRYVDSRVDGHKFIVSLGSGNNQSENDLYIVAYFIAS